MPREPAAHSQMNIPSEVNISDTSMKMTASRASFRTGVWYHGFNDDGNTQKDYLDQLDVRG